MKGPGDAPVRLGPWAVGRVIGTGETSSVHLCTHVDDPSRTAAIKILGRHDPDALARFRREAEILASLDHPNIVRVHGLELDEQLPYLEMDYLPGTPVSELLAEGPLPIAHALDITRQLLAALVYLHGRNVAHRDVRPNNLLIHEGRAVLVDFGLAKREAESGTGTRPGARFGAAAYAPPEWIGAKAVDGQVWDTYAVGAVLHELLTGRPPFPAPSGTPAHVQAARVMSAKREIEALDPGSAYPDDVRALVRDLTRRDPRDRITSAAAAAERLAAIATPSSEPVRPAEPIPAPTAEFRLASSAWTALVGLVALGALTLLLAVAWKLAASLL
jgi:serine/threonine protein kinase